MPFIRCNCCGAERQARRTGGVALAGESRRSSANATSAGAGAAHVTPGGGAGYEGRGAQPHNTLRKHRVNWATSIMFALRVILYF